jgi:hypothetical protein
MPFVITERRTGEAFREGGWRTSLWIIGSTLGRKDNWTPESNAACIGIYPRPARAGDTQRMAKVPEITDPGL